MSATPSPFDVGSRIAFDNSLGGFVAEWEYGTVTERAVRGKGYVYRIRWDDGFQDLPGGESEWYSHDELLTLDEAKARDAADGVVRDHA